LGNAEHPNENESCILCHPERSRVKGDALKLFKRGSIGGTWFIAINFSELGDYGGIHLKEVIQTNKYPLTMLERPIESEKNRA